MNTDNLHELINRYEDNLDMIYDKDHDELFKWKAMKVWRDEWFKPAEAFVSFGDRFTEARREFSVFIDNSVMHPSAGVIALWDKEPDKVERLFDDVLFAESKREPQVVQNNMDRFLEEYEDLRKNNFPDKWSYKQDRHSASVFLALNEPDFNYVYKASDAHMMEKYTDFGFSIGSGTSFSLPNYYRLCDEIVTALRQHDTLLDKHFNRLTEAHYKDNSLHLLAFDLMYCSNAYGFYQGLTAPSTGKPIRKRTVSGMSAEKLAQKEAEHQGIIKELEDQISELMSICEIHLDIDLRGVQVTSSKYGIGNVVEHSFDKIKVQFENCEKSFILNNRFAERPRFDEDESLVDLFTKISDAQAKVQKLVIELEALKA